MHEFLDELSIGNVFMIIPALHIGRKRTHSQLDQLTTHPQHSAIIQQHQTKSLVLVYFLLSIVGDSEYSHGTNCCVTVCQPLVYSLITPSSYAPQKTPNSIDTKFTTKLQVQTLSFTTPTCRSNFTNITVTLEHFHSAQFLAIDIYARLCYLQFEHSLFSLHQNDGSKS
jgi:hypothetical protein